MFPTKQTALKIQKRLDNEEELSEHDLLQYLSYIRKIPMETLEARLDQLKGRSLMTLPFDLPCDDLTDEEDEDDDDE